MVTRRRATAGSTEGSPSCRARPTLTLTPWKMRGKPFLGNFSQPSKEVTTLGSAQTSSSWW